MRFKQFTTARVKTLELTNSTTQPGAAIVGRVIVQIKIRSAELH